jgi:hypothetical protein
MTTFDDIAGALAEHGLIPRGGFHPTAADGVPGDPATLMLAGNAGPAMWQAFERGRRDEPEPLDAWTQRAMTAVAERLGATALFPFDRSPGGGPPWLPFQRWAMRGDAVYPSPIGPLIHPDYGLWHAYRGALAFRERIELPAADRRASPCDTCEAKPCLTACPVGAFSPTGYDVPACVAFLGSEPGRDCLDHGCRARRACPVGTAYRYESVQAGHHMLAFFRSNKDATT